MEDSWESQKVYVFFHIPPESFNVGQDIEKLVIPCVITTMRNAYLENFTSLQFYDDGHDIIWWYSSTGKW